MIKEPQQKTADNKTVPLKPNMDAPEDEKRGYKQAGLPEPTRYGDWEVKGRCSDF